MQRRGYRPKFLLCNCSSVRGSLSRKSANPTSTAWGSSSHGSTRWVASAKADAAGIVEEVKLIDIDTSTRNKMPVGSTGKALTMYAALSIEVRSLQPLENTPFSSVG